MIRLIATDLDGTLLDENGKLPEGTYEVISRLSDMGICVAACSGRQYGNLYRLFGPVSDRMAFVCENGALSVLDGKIAGTIAIESEMARAIIADLESYGMNVLISGRHTVYMVDQNRKFTDDIVYRLRNTSTILSSWDQITEPLLKISGQIDEGFEAIAPKLLEKWADKLTATASGGTWFDLTVANKGMGMEQLMQYMGLQKEEVAAFGDNFNDETMLDTVGHPFIMAHAVPALHKTGYHSCKKVLPVLEAIAEAKGDINKALRLCE